ncbi:hypothetical protein XELAEV_18039606mg, partial [Xenopus laevis]
TSSRIFVTASGDRRRGDVQRGGPFHHKRLIPGSPHVSSVGARRRGKQERSIALGQGSRGRKRRSVQVEDEEDLDHSSPRGGRGDTEHSGSSRECKRATSVTSPCGGKGSEGSATKDRQRLLIGQEQGDHEEPVAAGVGDVAVASTGKDPAQGEKGKVEKRETEREVVIGITETARQNVYVLFAGPLGVHVKWEFQQRLAANPTMRWDQMDITLWFKLMMAQKASPFQRGAGGGNSPPLWPQLSQDAVGCLMTATVSSAIPIFFFGKGNANIMAINYENKSWLSHTQCIMRSPVLSGRGSATSQLNQYERNPRHTGCCKQGSPCTFNAELSNVSGSRPFVKPDKGA